MKFDQKEYYDKMIGLIVEAQQMPPNSVHKTNKLLESIVFGIGVLILKEEKKDREEKMFNVSVKGRKK